MFARHATASRASKVYFLGRCAPQEPRPDGELGFCGPSGLARWRVGFCQLLRTSEILPGGGLVSARMPRVNCPVAAVWRGSSQGRRAPLEPYTPFASLSERTAKA